MRQRLLIVACAALLIAFGWALFGPARAVEAASVGGFVPPLPPPLTVLRGFDPPAQPWLPGNRGVDLAATTGEPVVAATGGVVLYAGLLAGRGVVSISHGAIRTTYEPVDAVVAAGESVRRGQVIGRVSSVADGCGPPGGCLHWGAIRGDAYLDPLGLLVVPQVRLLPIWADGVPTAAPGGALPAARFPPGGALPAARVSPSPSRPTARGHAAATSAASSATMRRTDGGEVTTTAAASAAAASVGLAAGIALRRRAGSPRARRPTPRKLPAL